MDELIAKLKTEKVCVAIPTSKFTQGREYVRPAEIKLVLRDMVYKKK